MDREPPPAHSAPAMLCTCFRTDPSSLVAFLTDRETLRRYQEAMVVEVKSLADRALLQHIKRMSTLASAVQAHGFEALARTDLPAADELLTDVFAVATWHGWELPAESFGEQDVTVEDLPRGLLAADAGTESARLWMLDGTTVALARSRIAGDQADMPTC
jgi:hypothetical protein